jgi:hypothetical protein
MTTLAWQRSGLLPPGAMVKLYFGGELEFGLRPTATALEAYLELLEPRVPGIPGRGQLDPVKPVRPA